MSDPINSDALDWGTRPGWHVQSEKFTGIDSRLLGDLRVQWLRTFEDAYNEATDAWEDGTFVAPVIPAEGVSSVHVIGDDPEPTLPFWRLLVGQDADERLEDLPGPDWLYGYDPNNPLENVSERRLLQALAAPQTPEALRISELENSEADREFLLEAASPHLTAEQAYNLAWQVRQLGWWATWMGIYGGIPSQPLRRQLEWWLMRPSTRAIAQELAYKVAKRRETASAAADAQWCAENPADCERLGQRILAAHPPGAAGQWCYPESGTGEIVCTPDPPEPTIEELIPAVDRLKTASGRWVAAAAAGALVIFLIYINRKGR